jgi:hypothetical protein
LRDEVLDAPFERRHHLLTIPEGTPISGELRGKRAMVGRLMNLGDLLEFRQEKPLEYYGNGERVVVWPGDRRGQEEPRHRPP